MEKSAKELALEKKIKGMLKGKARQAAESIFSDPEVCAMQDYANTVSIKRMGFNDHGPVHMKITTINAINMFNCLKQAGIMFNLEKEIDATEEDSLTAVVMAALLHDIGMSVSRTNHEIHGAYFAYPILSRILKEIYGDDLRQFAVRSTAIEGISGHMATQKITSLEAGIIMVADGCDMENGRARITSRIAKEAKIGDIHRYSASAINKVRITAGEEKPIKIFIEMESNTGYFQVEEVLFPKINISPIKQFIELHARKTGEPVQRYL